MKDFKNKFWGNLSDALVGLMAVVLMMIVIAGFAVLLALPGLGIAVAINTDNLVLGLTCGLFIIPWVAAVFAGIEVVSDRINRQRRQ